MMRRIRQLLCFASLACFPMLVAHEGHGHGRGEYENHQGNWDYDHHRHPYHDHGIGMGMGIITQVTTVMLTFISTVDLPSSINSVPFLRSRQLTFAILVTASGLTAKINLTVFKHCNWLS